MKVLFLVIFVQVLAFSQSALAEGSYQYFFANADIVNVGTMDCEPKTIGLLIKQFNQPSKNLIIETTTSPDPSGMIVDNVVFAHIDDGKMLLHGTNFFLKGEGNIDGTMSDWNSMSFSMSSQERGIAINGEYYRTQGGIASKKSLSLPGGQKINFDFEAKQISAEEYVYIYDQMYSQNRSK